MHRFIHTTEASFQWSPKWEAFAKARDNHEKAPSPETAAELAKSIKLFGFPADAKLVIGTRADKPIGLVHLTEELTVPTTTDDLIALAREQETESAVDCGGVKVKCTVACKRYIVGRKLESNQDRQSDLRSGVSAERRGDALAYWSELDIKAATASMIRSVRDKAYAKVHNAKLDTVAELLAAGDKEQAGVFLLKMNQAE